MMCMSLECFLHWREGNTHLIVTAGRKQNSFTFKGALDTPVSFCHQHVRSKNGIAPGSNLVLVSSRADLVLQCFLTHAKQHILVLQPLTGPCVLIPLFSSSGRPHLRLTSSHENKVAVICGFLHLGSLNSEFYFCASALLTLLSTTLTSCHSLSQQEVEELQKKNQLFQENQNQLSEKEEADLLADYSETMFRIHILALRLDRYWEWWLEKCPGEHEGLPVSVPSYWAAKLFCKTFYSHVLLQLFSDNSPSCSREKQTAPQKYLALEEKLRKDPRLAEHLGHAWLLLFSLRSDTGNWCWSLLKAALKMVERFSYLPARNLAFSSGSAKSLCAPVSGIPGDFNELVPSTVLGNPLPWLIIIPWYQKIEAS